MVAPATLLLIVAVCAAPLMVIVGSGRVSVTTHSVMSEALPLRTVMALMVTGEEALLERSMALLYTAPVDGVGSVPSRV